MTEDSPLKIQKAVEKNLFFAAFFTVIAVALLCLYWVTQSSWEAHASMKKAMEEFSGEDKVVTVVDIVILATNDGRHSSKPKCFAIVQNAFGQRACWPFLLPDSLLVPLSGQKYRPVLKYNLYGPLLFELEPVPADESSPLLHEHDEDGKRA